MDTLKKCPRCKLLLPETEFHKNNSKKSGLASACKVCVSLYTRVYYLKHAERLRAKRKEYHAENREADNEVHRQYYRKNNVALRASIKQRYSKNPEPFKAAKRRHKYGMSPETYANLLEQQNGKCAICRQPEHKKVKGILCALGIDHNHKTNTNRELLCSECNPAIGLLHEDISRIEAVVSYLKKWDGK